MRHRLRVMAAFPTRLRKPPGGVRLVGQQIEMSDDDVQYVVEIVCDAASEFAKRLHLLRLKQILLKGPLLSDVLNEPFEPKWVSGLVANDFRQ